MEDAAKNIIERTFGVEPEAWSSPVETTSDYSRGKSYRPLKPCKHPGCTNLSTTGYCEKHANEGKSWAQKNPPKRLRGRKSQDRRKRIAERDGYVCQICGRVTARGIADHIIPLAFGGSDTEDNMQWICEEPCHRIKTEQESKRGKNIG